MCWLAKNGLRLPKVRLSSYPEASHMISKTGEVFVPAFSIFSVPGPFEPEMPAIAEWFAKNPPKDTGT